MQVKIELCPICEQPLEDAAKVMVCHPCMVWVDPNTGEITRPPEKKAIISIVLGKIKGFLWL